MGELGLEVGKTGLSDLKTEVETFEGFGAFLLFDLTLVLSLNSTYSSYGCPVIKLPSRNDPFQRSGHYGQVPAFQALNRNMQGK